MSALRRLTHASKPASASNSPNANGRGVGHQETASRPATPRSRISYPISPSNSPSLSAIQPFDWDAALNKKPPPYATPLQGARIKALRRQEVGTSSPRRVVRKKSLLERLKDLPSYVTLQIMMLPHTIPTPSPKHSAQLAAGAVHVTHFLLFIFSREKPDREAEWEELVGSDEDGWFNWSTFIRLLLVVLSVLNSVYLFTRIKLYDLHHRKGLAPSSHAAFVSVELDFEPLKPPTVTQRLMSWLKRSISSTWRFLFNLSAPHTQPSNSSKMERFQQLSVWVPGEFELNLFVFYSPVHALLWYGTTASNWILMFLVMGLSTVQLRTLNHEYEGLVKDRAIISAEVMHEYDQKFVIPRIFPIRKDACVMTHEAEIVSIWDD